MTCKKYIGKKWGLNPDKMKWIYNQVILPTLSYACFLWVHKINKNKYMLKMHEKIQKMASLKITGGFITTPTITLDSISGIMPIEIRLESVALKTAIRLQTNKNWEHILPNPNRKMITHSHHIIKRLEDIIDASEMKLSDKTIDTKMKREYKTYTGDNIIDNPDKTTLKIYTDGSVMKIGDQTRAGSGVIIYKNKKTIKEISIPLGLSATINQCEMIAIREGAELAVSLIDNSITHVNFYTDSITTIHRLEAISTSSKLTLETNSTLNNLTKCDVTVSIIKVKAHTGIEGNEAADKLAKKGASTKEFGPEPFTYFTEKYIADKISKEATKNTLIKIREAKIKTENKKYIEIYAEKQGYKLPTTNKNHIRHLTQIISGQNKLAAKLNRMDETIVPFCQHCPTERETTEHFMARCPAHAEVRFQIFQQTHTNLLHILENHKPAKIIEYINKTKRMEDDYICYYIED